MEKDKHTPSLGHTPLPWKQSHRICDDEGNYSTQVYCEKGETIATLSWYSMPQEEVILNGRPMVKRGTFRDGNAAFIIRACNNHYALLEALKELNKTVDDYWNSDKRGEAEILRIIDWQRKSLEIINECEG